MPKQLLAIVTAGLWITVSEFLRNELLFKNYWVEHYSWLGLTFETMAINGILWMVWSFGLAYIIYELLKHFSFGKTVFLIWLVAFVLMWITLFNLQVLPLILLIPAIPLGILEVVVATAIIQKVQATHKT